MARELWQTLRIMRMAGATWTDYADLIRDYLDDDERDWSWNV